MAHVKKTFNVFIYASKWAKTTAEHGENRARVVLSESALSCPWHRYNTSSIDNKKKMVEKKRERERKETQRMATEIKVKYDACMGAECTKCVL